MAEDFWGPIFARLHEDINLLELMLQDTSDSDISAWVKPNPALAVRCGRFFKKGKLTDRAACAKEILQYAQTNQPLRKIIFFTWIEKNSLAMSIPSLPLDEANQGKIFSGEFGTPAKIKIMASVDPRPAAREFYDRYLAANKVITRQADINVVPEAVSENEIKLYQAETRIKELQSALDNTKTENRQNKKLATNQELELVGQRKKIKDQSTLLAELCENAKKLNTEIARLQQELQASTASEHTQSDQPRTSDYDQTAAEIRIENLNNEIISLQKALSNRDSSIARLEAEKSALHDRLASADQQEQRINNLQKKLAEKSHTPSSANFMAGQIIAPLKSARGKKSWLFLSITGDTCLINQEIFNKAQVVAEEYCLLTLDEARTPLLLKSLEEESRQVMLGTIKVNNGTAEFCNHNQSLPVMCDASELSAHPVRATWLTELPQRPAGVYGLEVLKTAKSHETVPISLGSKQIKSYFNADFINMPKFCIKLQELQVDFELNDEHNITLAGGGYEVLNSLRMKLEIKTFCNKPSCTAAAEETILARSCKSGDICSSCATATAPTTEPIPMFAGQKVAIFGGDRVGSEFERTLSQLNLKITWHSGFLNLHELTAGLGKVDLVLIITRQISHTLLRELVSYCQKEQLKMVFCRSRGTTGIIRELEQHLNP